MTDDTADEFSELWQRGAQISLEMTERYLGSDQKALIVACRQLMGAFFCSCADENGMAVAEMALESLINSIKGDLKRLVPKGPVDTNERTH